MQSPKCQLPAQSHGHHTKKKTTTYKEQKPEQVAAYQQALSQYTEYQAVFLDETGFDTFFYRPYAYSKKGVPVKAQISGRKYQRISLVAAQIQGKGSLISPMTYCGTMDGSLFEAWFEQMLLPELTEKSVIIMDNARFHRMAVLTEMAQKQGHKVLPLAPYSPELNPIEKVWANIKKHLRKVLPAVGNFMTALLRSSYFN